VTHARITLTSESADLAVEAAHACRELALEVDPRAVPDAVEAAIGALGEGEHVAVLTPASPGAPALVRLARAARTAGRPCALAVVGAGSDATLTLALAGDLGLVAVDEVRPLASALALLAASAQRPWAATTRGLSPIDRGRLRAAVSAGEKAAGRILRRDDGLLGYAPDAHDAGHAVGEPRDLAAALSALSMAEPDVTDPLGAPDATTRQAVLEVIFGPPRALSDPASKAALRHHGLPFPAEELCASPSRAASEATRLGYPVRITLASPDLRVWDHPDLTVDGVDNAARVRDVYRQLVTQAEARSPGSRLLGVTVTTTRAAQALLRAEFEPLPEGLIGVRLGFADAHGLASRDETLTVWPASAARFERVLARLRGSELVFAGTPAVRRAATSALHDVLTRLARFVDAHRGEVERVRLQPLALLFGGAVEAREVCVTVGEAFRRSLEQPAEPSG
jgi:hypothetical protein